MIDFYTYLLEYQLLILIMVSIFETWLNIQNYVIKIVL